MAVTKDELGALAGSYLDRQRWFQLTVPGRAPTRSISSTARCCATSPRRSAACCSAVAAGASVFVGWRDTVEVSDALHGRGAIFGSVLDGHRTTLVYDTLADDVLAIELFRRATRGRERRRGSARVATAVSHASLVYDGRFLMKCYRVLEDTTRPEIEVLMKLDAVGFNAILAPVAVWQSDGFDLTLSVREFLPSALEGRLLTLTSLRDLLARVSGYDRADTAVTTRLESGSTFDLATAAAAAGGDLASEMRRLGGPRRVCISRSPTPSERPRCRPRRSPTRSRSSSRTGSGGGPRANGSAAPPTSSHRGFERCTPGEPAPRSGSTATSTCDG